MSLILTDAQQCALSISIADKKGNPAKVDGVPQWTTSDPNVLTVEPAADGMSATVKAVGPLAEAVQVNVSADADLGSGTKAIVGVLDVQVVAGEAVAVGVTAGTPEEQA